MSKLRVTFASPEVCFGVASLSAGPEALSRLLGWGLPQPSTLG
jgi:hypothetical protein